jgi:hypothetical protein
MNRRDIGRLHRLLRHRARLTQEDVARSARIRRWKIVRIEANDLDKLRIADVEQSFGALGAQLFLGVSYQGAAADRLLDELHALLIAACVRELRRRGWDTRVEVSFNVYGDRGSIDLLAWHDPTRTLLIVEVKSELGSIEGTLRPLDVKLRRAPAVARDRFGWHAAHIARVLVLPSDRTARRHVERHADLLRVALPATSSEVRTWLRRPSGPLSGIWFVTDAEHVNGKRNPSAVRRIRRPRPRSATGSAESHLPPNSA